MRLAGHVAGMREIINAYKILDGKPEGRRPLGVSHSCYVCCDEQINESTCGLPATCHSVANYSFAS
jgi:hypothetical protein